MSSDGVAACGPTTWPMTGKARFRAFGENCHQPGWQNSGRPMTANDIQGAIGVVVGVARRIARIYFCKNNLFCALFGAYTAHHEFKGSSCSPFYISVRNAARSGDFTQVKLSKYPLKANASF